MDNLAQYYILDEDNNDIDTALDPIYLIHNFIKKYGLNNFQIIQQPPNINIRLTLARFIHTDGTARKPHRLRQLLLAQARRAAQTNQGVAEIGHSSPCLST